MSRVRASVLLLALAFPALAAAPLPLAPAEATEIGMWRGSWNTEADLAFEPRAGSSVAVTPASPHGVIVWGGSALDGRLLTDGVLIDSGDPSRSRLISPAPLRPRLDHGWAGKDGHAYVWGGVDATGRSLSDGAEYGETWVPMPAGPLPGGPASMIIVDGELWVVATDPDSGEAVVSSIPVPLEDGASWSPLVTVPLRPGERYDIVGCCDGDPGWLFVLSIAADGPAEAAGLDLGGGASRWTELGMVPVPSSPAARPATGVAIEQQFAAWAGNLDAESGGQRATLLSLRRPSDPWVVTAPTNQAIDAGPLLLSPNHLISPLAGLAYDLVEPRWLHLPARPGQDSGAPLAASWWDRGRLWVLDANGQDGSSRLWSFQPRALKGAQQLPSGTRPPTAVEPCVLFGETGIWRLRGDPRDDRLVWLQRGARREYLDWPDGWHVRFEPAVVITDSAGKVRHREGGRCPAVTGTGG